MKRKSVIMHYSLFVALMGAAITPCYMAHAAGVRVGNASRSYADAYNQVNVQRQMGDPTAPVYSAVAPSAVAQNTDTELALPVRVANTNVANTIARGGSTPDVDMARLQRCAAIYPNGEFAWDTPTAGTSMTPVQTCVAVVEMRGFQMGPGGGDVVLARANIAAGDSIKCNISDFPEIGYTADAGNIVFPADAEPTMDDVVKVMNQEQKKNAGFKIAATTIVGALGGNMAGGNEIGEDKLLGTGKKKMKSTLLGGLGGAAIGAGGAFAGKVGGDVILSTGMNAAAGGIVGNISASGDPVLRLEDCTFSDGATKKCLWGVLVAKEPLNLKDSTASDYKVAFYGLASQDTLVCDGTPDDKGVYKNCREEELVSVELEGYKNIEEADREQYAKITDDKQYRFERSETGARTVTQGTPNENGIYAKIVSADKAGKKIPAAVTGDDIKDKTFGAKKADWRKWQAAKKNIVTYRRDTLGKVTKVEDSPEYDIKNFFPMYVDAEDGGIIDLDNKARLKSTLIGAGAGGAIGAFSGYQGAQSDIENRWVTAVREYKDSLQKVYCVTGQRFLSYYNDIVIVPSMGE